MDEINLQEVQETLLEIAFEAGRMMLAADSSSMRTDTKISSVDLVTETDRAIEIMVSARLRTAYPSFHFVGEETYKAGSKITTAPTFVVDPIDGTTNFVHGFPHACISLGLAVGGHPAVGVVYNPLEDVVFTATRGGGSFMQRSPAGGSPDQRSARLRLPLRGEGDGTAAPALTGLGAALIAVEWGSRRTGPNYKLQERVLGRLARCREEGGSMVHGLRSLGSAALNLCAVAAGQLDAYWEGGCYAWDVCAGWCVLEEAGGMMVGGNPGDWETTLDSRVYLAVRGARAGQRKLVDEFWALMGDSRLDFT